MPGLTYFHLWGYVGDDTSSYMAKLFKILSRRYVDIQDYVIFPCHLSNIYRLIHDNFMECQLKNEVEYQPFFLLV